MIHALISVAMVLLHSSVCVRVCVCLCFVIPLQARVENMLSKLLQAKVENVLSRSAVVLLSKGMGQVQNGRLYNGILLLVLLIL